MRRNQQGMTFIELMVASVISAAVAGGTLAAMVTAARLSNAKASPQVGEAAMWAEQSIEQPRNHVAADDLNWFTSRAGTWQDNPPLPGPTSSESILQPPGAQRRQCITPVDEDRNGTTDYYAVQVRVCWDNTATCPAPGTPCL